MLTKAHHRTVGCYEEAGAGPRAEAFLCFQCGWTLTSSEHQAPRNTDRRGRGGGGAGRHFCAATDVTTKSTNCPISALRMSTLR